MLSDFESTGNGYLRRANIVKHWFELLRAHANPNPSAPFLVGQKNASLRKKIKAAIREEVVEATQTKREVPRVSARKKHGYIGFCVDYQRGNGVEKQDVFRIPRMHRCIDSLRECVVFSTPNVSREKWQAEIENGDGEKTAFSSHHWLYVFLRMQFR